MAKEKMVPIPGGQSRSANVPRTERNPKSCFRFSIAGRKNSARHDSWIDPLARQNDRSRLISRLFSTLKGRKCLKDSDGKGDVG